VHQPAQWIDLFLEILQPRHAGRLMSALAMSSNSARGIRQQTAPSPVERHGGPNCPGGIPEENRAKAARIEPDFPAVVRKVFDLAATAPNAPEVRDAMLWMIMHGAGERHAGEFALAANWLIQHRGDDPDAVRVGLGEGRKDRQCHPY
jgi:hypothetical protein